MANHRPYSERKKILDQRLSNGVGYTCKQLMAHCNVTAKVRSYKSINSKTTLLADLSNIEYCVIVVMHIPNAERL